MRKKINVVALIFIKTTTFIIEPKDRTGQRQIKFLCLEDLVPQDHLLRDIDRARHFKFIYDEEALKETYRNLGISDFTYQKNS